MYRPVRKAILSATHTHVTMSRDLTPPPSDSALQQARRWFLESGDIPAGLVTEALQQSWLRSRHAGLSPLEHPGHSPTCDDAELRQALGTQREFLAHARPVMDFLFDQVRDCGNLVILSDARGLLLHALGDNDFSERADRVSLRPGALWHEHDRGTNAIGTALAEQRAVVIHGAEHYLARNSFLTCAAAPVVASDGQLRGVLDISGDHRSRHPHTFALVRSAARMIEDRLFHARHLRDQILRLHPHPEGLGAVGEGLVALSDDGWVIGANTLARNWLSLSDGRIGCGTLEQLTGLRLGQFPPGRIMRCRLPHGDAIHAKLEPRHKLVVNLGEPALRLHEPESPAPAVSRPPTVPSASASASAKTDAKIQDAFRRACRVQTQGIALLIQGESGAGKEVFARALHAEGPRSNHAFVALNCAALPETLIEAELFGYVGGAFTGARREGSPGRIREADGGTLFLDEIGDMPLSLQARLLRVLQDKTVVPLGGSKSFPVDFQLVCATHRHLKEAVRAGHFREDLYYRLNGLTVTLPALRERQDFDELVHTTLSRTMHDMGNARTVTLNPGLMQAMRRYTWPGNLRQLNALLRTMCALLETDESALDWHHLPEDMVSELQEAVRSPEVASPTPASTADTFMAEANLKRLSGQAIRHVIDATGGNMSEAARRLGISRNTLYRRIKQGLD